jgi:hypothetical protein
VWQSRSKIIVQREQLLHYATRNQLDTLFTIWAFGGPGQGDDGAPGINGDVHHLSSSSPGGGALKDAGARCSASPTGTVPTTCTLALLVQRLEAYEPGVVRIIFSVVEALTYFYPATATTICILGPHGDPGDSAVSTVAIAPDGTSLAAAGFDGCIRIYDLPLLPPSIAVHGGGAAPPSASVMSMRPSAHGFGINAVAYSSARGGGALLVRPIFARLQSVSARRMRCLVTWYECDVM